jgi:hypothetical protein
VLRAEDLTDADIAAIASAKMDPGTGISTMVVRIACKQMYLWRAVDHDPTLPNLVNRTMPRRPA